MGGELVDWEGWYWPNHFGDPIAEHHAIRNDVGVWDASPLRKWGFSGPDAMKAADRIFTNDMLSLEVGQVRYAPFCDENGKMVGDGTVFKTADDQCIASPRSTPISITSRPSSTASRVEIEPMTTVDAAARDQRPPLARAPAEPRRTPTSPGLRYFRFWPEQVKVGGVPCWVSRTGYSGELGYELFCSPDGAEQLWDAVVGAGARPYGLAAVETIRIESGLIFIGYDYFQHETSPYDMGLDKLIRLDKAEFCGKDALAAEAASPPNRFVTLVVDGAGSRVRRRRDEGRRAGRHADEPVREPDARQGDRPDGAAHRPRPRGRDASRSRSRAALPRRRSRPMPLYDTREEAPASVGARRRDRFGPDAAPSGGGRSFTARRDRIRRGAPGSLVGERVMDAFADFFPDLLAVAALLAAALALAPILQRLHLPGPAASSPSG